MSLNPFPVRSGKIMRAAEPDWEQQSEKKAKRMMIQPIKLKDLIQIMGEDFELILDRAMNPTAPGVKLANFVAQMNSEECTSLMLGLAHLNPEQEFPPMPVDEKAELSDMDTLDAELDELMEWFDG